MNKTEQNRNPSHNWRKKQREKSITEENMTGMEGSYQANEVFYGGDYIGTQPVRSQYPGMWFDPRISQKQCDGVNFLQMIPPYSLAYPVHQIGTSTHPLAVVSNNSVPVTGQQATPVVKHKENALVLSPGFGMNMSYTQMLLAAESEDPLFGSPHTKYYPVGAENETFMITGRNTRLSELVDMDNPKSSKYIEQDDPSNWNNNQTDFQEADLALQTVTWDDGVPAHGAELLQALGICPGDNQNEDDTCSEDSDTDPSAFNKVLVVGEEDANQVVAGHGDNEVVDDDANQFSPDDIDNFLENDSVLAAQTCSQEVRSRHVPQMGMDFETSKGAQAFYNNYSCLCGFAVRKASNYCGQTSAGGGESRCIFRCNRARKVLDEEQKKAKRQQRKDRWQQRTRKLAPETRKRKRNVIDVTGCQAKLVFTKKMTDGLSQTSTSSTTMT
ncbi:uncharacterized protein [Triticum aestivum]|uniref:uncharacterized protein n=1 Tax=Triticum aestivum TaxID=4565 RepID=UPI001D033CE1|nr:uncharacterized protein LOC123123235 [Triticum aestivum]